MKITVVGMIYRSISYLDFMARGMLNVRAFGNAGDGNEVKSVVVANDATPAVLNWLQRYDIEHFDYRDPKPGDYYLNRVYRAWNAGAEFAKDADVVVFVNSDMWPAQGWLKHLIGYLDDRTIPCSRLVESGKMPSGRWAISRDFGRSPESFRQCEFDDFAKTIATPADQPRYGYGGLFMPCAFHRKKFIEAGGYPEGNVCAGGVGQHTTKFVESGDSHFFYRNSVMSEREHVTVFDSVVYHFQQGEMDE